MIESVGCRGGNQLVRGVASRPTHWPTCRYIGDSFMLAFNVRVFSPFLRLNFPGPTRVYDAVAEKPTAALRDGAVVRIPCTRTLVVAITRAHPDHLFFFSFFFLNSKVTKYSDVSTFQDFNGRGRVFYFGNFSGMISHTKLHPATLTTSPLSLHLSKSTRRSRKMKRENGSSRSSLEGRR